MVESKLRAGKVRVPMTAGNVSTKPRVRAKHARATQPRARCITGFFCSACRPDYNIAIAMGLHPRLGQVSPLAQLTDDLLHKIIENTKPRRTLPAWMSCSFSLRKASTPQATPACSLASNRDREECCRRETMRESPTQRPSQTAQERQCNRRRALAT